ncbi:MAG: hypothetical protein FJ038_13990 [Chloroflexi bacterium]|nr:hypothetical protein [Chloroflexota bacterium]
MAGFALPPAAGGPPAVLGEVLVGVDAGRVARAGALGLAVVALPLVLGRGPLGSIAIGSAVLLSGAELLLAGLFGPRTPLEHLLLAATQALLAAGTLVVVAAAPVGPPLAGRIPVPGANETDAAAPPLAGRRRIPVWPGIRSVVDMATTPTAGAVTAPPPVVAVSLRTDAVMPTRPAGPRSAA